MDDQQPIACEGDPTSGGGFILEGDGSYTVDDLRVAFEGAKALCHVHGMTHIAKASSLVSVSSGRVARNGDLLACGHHVVVVGFRRASSDRYSSEGGGYACRADLHSSNDGSRSQTDGGRVVCANSEHLADEAFEVGLRLLCGQGRPHRGLRFVKTMASVRGTTRQTSSEGLTTPLPCRKDTVLFVAIAVPAMEVG